MTIEQRHKNMAAIRGKNTKPELLVRKHLWARGFRYRLNYPRLPGKPDIVLTRYRTCIFVNGCFWHGHNVNVQFDESPSTTGAEQKIENSPCCKIPKSNRPFWVSKIRRNQQRDREVQQRLAAMGWHCITVWECDLKPDRRHQTLESLCYTINHIYLNDHTTHHYTMEDEEPLRAAEDDN